MRYAMCPFSLTLLESAVPRLVVRREFRSLLVVDVPWRLRLPCCLSTQVPARSNVHETPNAQPTTIHNRGQAAPRLMSHRRLHPLVFFRKELADFFELFAGQLRAHPFGDRMGAESAFFNAGV